MGKRAVEHSLVLHTIVDINLDSMLLFALASILMHPIHKVRSPSRCLKSFAAPSEALEPSRQQTSATDDHDDAAHNAAYSGTSVNSRRTGSRSARRQRDRRRLTKGSQHGCRKNEPVSPDRSSGDDESVESSPERYIGKKVTTFMKKKKTNPATFNNS